MHKDSRGCGHQPPLPPQEQPVSHACQPQALQHPTWPYLMSCLTNFALIPSLFFVPQPHPTTSPPPPPPLHPPPSSIACLSLPFPNPPSPPSLASTTSASSSWSFSLRRSRSKTWWRSTMSTSPSGSILRGRSRMIPRGPRVIQEQGIREEVDGATEHRNGMRSGQCGEVTVDRCGRCCG